MTIIVWDLLNRFFGNPIPMRPRVFLCYWSGHIPTIKGVSEMRRVAVNLNPMACRDTGIATIQMVATCLKCIFYDTRRYSTDEKCKFSIFKIAFSKCCHIVCIKVSTKRNKARLFEHNILILY